MAETIATYRQAFRVREELEEGTEETRFSINSLDRLGWFIRRMGELHEEIAMIEEARRLEKDEIDLKADGLIRTRNSEMERLKNLYSPQAEEFVRRSIKGKRKKSVSTFWGLAGYRKTRGSVEILLMEEAVAFAKKAGIELKVVETVNKTPLKEYIEKTGEIPPGVEYEPPHDEFYLHFEPRTEHLFAEDREETSASP